MPPHNTKDYCSSRDIKSALAKLSKEARELYLGRTVPDLDCTPSPLTFYRDYVSHNRPVVIRGGVSHWSAVSRWSNPYLKQTLGDLPVSVTVTPNGYADAPQGGLFVMPEERTMNMGDFVDIIENPESANGVFYIQKQNSNLTEEFKDIIGDIEADLDWATEAFGKKPDAVNLWMGDERAVTSMHKDPYENIYCVVRGHKDLVLQPPTDLPWVPYRDYKPAIYKEDKKTGDFEIEEINTSLVPWIAIDPTNPDLETYPAYSNSTQFKLRLEAGDVLYLPSLWFHYLSQSHGCIAINYWYDMEFDIKYNYYNLVKKLKKIINNNKV
eukprot:GFUD01028587.1.p1 GENE.GFUD01028587.1~~GFUD01028587.1.p1  ORF type:complete len:325 (-),score=73.91 GFUD01028587.1:9-983(-)